MRLLSFALLMLTLPNAFANVGIIRKAPLTQEGPWVSQTNIVVESEALTLTVTQENGELRCSFEARYQLKNPTDTPETVAGTFIRYGELTTPGPSPQFMLDGRVLDPYQLTEDERRALQEKLERLEEGSKASAASSSAPSSTPSYRAEDAYKTLKQDPSSFTLTLDAQQQQTLVVTGRLEGGYSLVNDYAKPALTSRHPLLAPDSNETNEQRFYYALSPIRTWAGDPTIKIALHTPKPWLVEGSLSTATLPWSARQDQDTLIREASLDAAQATTLILVVTPQKKLRNAGLLIGAGALLNDADGFQVRLGYELALRDYLFVGLASELSLNGRANLTPFIEAASPFVLIIPSLGLGVGVPMQRTPQETNLGVRVQLDAMLGPVGVVIPFDLFPAADDKLQVSIMGQLSL